MLSLPQVLHEAQRHSVDEIAIERGEPVTFHGEQGALILGEPLGDADISEALSQVLAPEQQAELAVAGVVEFYVEGYAEWSLVAETADDSMIIRGRMREGDSPREVGAPLDLPPLKPFEPEGADIPQPADSVLHQRTSRSTRWDMGIATGMSDPSSTTDLRPATPRPPPADAPPGPIAEDDAVADDSADADADDDDIDFALVGGTGPEDLSPGLEQALSEPELEPPIDFAEPAPPAKHGTGAMAAGPDSLAAHAGAIEPGAVVYLAGIDQGEALLEHLDDGFDVIDDDTWAMVTVMPFSKLAVGRSYLVRLEDPSRCLSWLLRRVEEGARVVVEGRARTSEGSRRTLLGGEATRQLVDWLDANPQYWLYPDGFGGWLLESL